MPTRFVGTVLRARARVWQIAEEGLPAEAPLQFARVANKDFPVTARARRSRRRHGLPDPGACGIAGRGAMAARILRVHREPPFVAQHAPTVRARDGKARWQIRRGPHRIAHRRQIAAMVAGVAGNQIARPPVEHRGVERCTIKRPLPAAVLAGDDAPAANVFCALFGERGWPHIGAGGPGVRFRHQEAGRIRAHQSTAETHGFGAAVRFAPRITGDAVTHHLEGPAVERVSLRVGENRAVDHRALDAKAPRHGLGNPGLLAGTCRSSIRAGQQQNQDCE